MTGDRAQSDVEALGNQALALGEFGRAGAEAVAQAERGAHEVVDRVNVELARRRVSLARCEDALRGCLQAEKGSCEGEARAVALAQRQLETALTALRMAERARSRFQAPKARYVREASRLEGEGKRRLSAMSGDLERYLQAASAGAGVTSANLDKAGSNDGGTGSQGMPDGWEDVPLAAVDDSDSGVTGAESFGKGYSPEDLTWAFGALHEVVLPAMARGKGLDYFRERDHAEGRIGSRSYADTYHGFFGKGSAIKLDRRADGRYGVGNGYHRIWVAKRMGLSSVPGWIR